jgi:hypothetical protein
VYFCVSERRQKKRSWEAAGQGLSVVDDAGIFFQKCFRLSIKLIGHLMDLKLMAALCATHPDPSAHSQDLKLSFCTDFAAHFYYGPFCRCRHSLISV